MIVGNQIRSYRKEHKLSQMDLAENYLDQVKRFLIGKIKSYPDLYNLIALT